MDHPGESDGRHRHARQVTGTVHGFYEGFGRLLPDAALTVATGGGGAAVKGVRIAEDAADAARARKLIDDAPDGTHNRPDGERTTDGADPVDLPPAGCSCPRPT